MKERPILVAVIGYIIGILWGLYFRSSIVLCYISILTTYYILKKFLKNHKKHKFKLLSFNRYSRYLRLMINAKVIFILIILSSISNTIVLYQNNQYEKAYQEGEKIQNIGIVISQKIEKQYYNMYQVKLLNGKHFNMYIQVNRKLPELEYGDKVKLEGEYKKPSEQRNYGGYNDKQYLKTLKIIGRVKVNQLEIVGKKQMNVVSQLANRVHEKIKEKIDTTYEKEKSAILKGLLLGETSEIQNEVKENFQIANISHVLAISGMHISYMIIGIQFVLKKAIGKRKTGIVTIILLIFYAFITGFSPSIVRAVVMGTIVIGAGMVYRKNDIGNSIAISLLGILVYNPFLILNVGLQLSYLGTIGIILFCSTILKFFDGIKLKKGIAKKIKEMVTVTLSAQIAILPILIHHFNIVGIYFLITNLIVGMIIGPLIISGFFSIFIKPLKVLVNEGLEVLTLVASFSKLPFSKMYLPTPHIITIILYFILIGIAHQIYNIYHLNHLTATQQRVKNIIALFQYKFQQKRKIYSRYLVIGFIVIGIVIFLPKNLRIYFVDVGQGDCTFIVTPHNKTILIDGGGSLTDEFDVGKKTLIPYLLDRGYTSIDYIIISHFDQDHVGGILSVLEELEVRHVIINKQIEDSENYQKFLKIVKEKKVVVQQVKKEDRILIEKNLYIDIMWPNKNQISENPLNNNSIVCKLNYYNFSLLFTGDIEEIAEKQILENYKNSNILNSTILKVAHHGSKSSTTKEFLEKVNPKIALIGVGENNTFGHPNSNVLNRLNKTGVQVYRTDVSGEISIIINKRGSIQIKLHKFNNACKY